MVLGHLRTGHLRPGQLRTDHWRPWTFVYQVKCVPGQVCPYGKMHRGHLRTGCMYFYMYACLSVSVCMHACSSVYVCMYAYMHA